MSEITASEGLIDLVYKGLEHGINSIKDGKGPLIPFVMIQNNGEIELRRFVSETLEDSIAEAKDYISNLANKPAFVIMAYDAMITIEGTKYDAIMVDGYDKSDPKGYCFAQRYKPKKFLSRLKEIGNVALVDEIESLLLNK